MNVRRVFPVALAVVALVALGSASQAAAAPQLKRSISVRALASGGWRELPLTGARLTVRSRGRVVARGRVGRRGTAVLPARRPVRGAPLRVVVRGGRINGRRFAGTMVAEVGRYRWPHTVYVDSSTTLAARFHRAHPQLSLRQVTRRTRRFLELPAGYQLGRDGAADVVFDGRRFLARASWGRRYEALIGHLAQRMRQRDAHHSFARRWNRSRSRGHADVSALALDLDSGGAASDLAGAAGGVANGVTKASGFFDVLQKANYVLAFVKAIVSISGIGNDAATSAELRELREALSQVQESVAAVRKISEEAVEQGARRGYSELAAAAEPTVHAIEEAEHRLADAADDTIQYGCNGAGSSSPRCAEVRAMITGPGGFSAELLRELPGAGELRSFASHIAGQAVPGTAGDVEGLIEAASELTTVESGLVFFTPASSRNLRAISSYWVASFATGLALAPAAWRISGQGQLSVESALEGLQPIASAMRAAIPSQVPAGTAIEMQHGTMWPTQVSAVGTVNDFTWFEEGDPWSYSAAAKQWVSATSAGKTVAAILGESAGQIPFGDWTVAGPAQIQPLLEAAAAAEPGQSAGETVLAQSGMERAIVTPSYAGGAQGLETQPVTALEGASSGCGDLASSNCYWPIWEAGGATIGDFNHLSPTYAYSEGSAEVVNWDGLPLPVFGLENETLYGNDPIAKIPHLFSRAVTAGECYYYPAAGAPAAGSPGCPDAS